MAGEQELTVTPELHASAVSQVSSLQLQHAEQLAARYLSQVLLLENHVQQLSTSLEQERGAVEERNRLRTQLRDAQDENDDLSERLGAAEAGVDETNRVNSDLRDIVAANDNHIRQITDERDGLRASADGSSSA